MINIAIDGPTASGKSTIAKLVASALGYRYVDTGAMFRSVALGAIKAGIDLDDEEAVSAFVKTTSIDFLDQQIYLNGINVEHEIRTSQMGVNASIVGRYRDVRNHLKGIQQQMILNGGVVMDGRDIGTAIMPDAALKIFQIAEVDVRAKRRYLELSNHNQEVSYETVLNDLMLRDRQDTERKESPLSRAHDAIVLDTTHGTIDQHVNQIILLAKERGA